MRFNFAGFVSVAFAAGSLFGQSVLSVKSGLVHYAEGKVYAADKLVEPKFGHFPELKNNDELRTEEGRAEVLLSPGSFLRVAENSSVRMISNLLTDTKIELLTGEALIETVDQTKDRAAAMVKGNSITMLYKDASISLVKSGVYVFNADSGRLRVYEGEAIVNAGGSQLTLKKGKETQLNGVLMATKFDSKLGDELVRWSYRRAGYVAMANVSAAKSFRDNGYGSGGFSLLGGGFGSGWAFNPYYGMYTFVPGYGFASSPFGYNYWSPFNVGQFYAYAPYLNGSYYGYGNGGNYSGAGFRNPGSTYTTSLQSATAATRRESVGSSAPHSLSGFAAAETGGGRGGYSGGGNSGVSSVSSGMSSAPSASSGAGAAAGGHSGGGGRR
ncbi:MAG: FecR domain-containing protein [Acidobacteriota bacterium]|nr:FecR domain-containing protein [Acidobacteriota bacterium]